MKLDLIFDTEKMTKDENERKEIKEIGFPHVFKLLVTALINMKYPEGVSGLEMKIVHRILNKLDDVSGDEIEIETAELDFLLDLFVKSDPKIRLNILNLFMEYRNRIEKLGS